MPRHCYKIRPQCPKIHRQDSRRLCPVDHKWHAIGFAQPRHLLNRQNIAKYIGNMGKDRRRRSLFQRSLPSLQGIRPIKQPAAGNLHLGPSPMQRSNHCIVLKPGDHHPVARLHQGVDGDIQSMGAVCGQHHLLRLTGKEFSRHFPAAVNLLHGFLTAICPWKNWNAFAILSGKIWNIPTKTDFRSRWF